MAGGVGNEVGLLLVPRARSVVGPAALRAPGAARLHARGDGSHGGVLEAGVAHS